MYKRTRSFTRSQVKSIIDLDVFESFLETIPQSALDTVDYLFKLAALCQSVYPSQKTIGEKAGICRMQVSRHLFPFEEMGVINSYWRSTGPDNKKTNIYKVNPIFNYPDVRKRFEKYFPSLGILSIVWLMSCMAITVEALPGSNRQKVTQVKRNNYIYPKSTARASSILVQSHRLPAEKKESNEMELKTPSQALMGLRCFGPHTKLTKAGIYTLMAFPDEALIAAEKTVKGAKGLREPFRFFYKLCRDYCTQNGLQADYSYSKQLFISNQVDPDGPMVEQDSSLKSQITSLKQQTGSSPHGPGRCADSSCSSLPCLDSSHPLRTREWANQQRTHFTERRKELVELYGEVTADHLMNQVLGMIPQIDNSHEVNILPKETNSRMELLTKASEMDIEVPFFGDDSQWEEL